MNTCAALCGAGVESGERGVWCIFDNTAMGTATGNALTLQELITQIELGPQPVKRASSESDHDETARCAPADCSRAIHTRSNPHRSNNIRSRRSTRRTCESSR